MKSIAGPALAALLLTAAVFATTSVTATNGGLDFDGVFYAAMAGHPQLKPELARVAPWAYRVATPALVQALPWDTLTSFRVLVFATNVAALLLIFLILKGLGFADRLCWIGLALYAGVFWAVKFSFASPAYIDAETQLVLLAIIYLTVHAYYLPLVAVLIVAGLQKEALAAFSVFAAVALIRQQGGRVTLSTGLLGATLIAAPFCTIFAVRSMVTTLTSIDTGKETEEQLRLLVTPGYWPVLLHSSFSGLGLLGIVVLLRPRRWLAFVREHYEWIAYVAIALAILFGGRDKGRLFLNLLPAAVIFAVMVIDDLQVLKSGTRGLAWIAVLLLTHAYLGNYLTPMADGLEGLARLVPEHSEGTYLPYLWRNIAITAGFLLATLVLARRLPRHEATAE